MKKKILIIFSLCGYFLLCLSGLMVIFRLEYFIAALCGIIPKNIRTVVSVSFICELFLRFIAESNSYNNYGEITLIISIFNILTCLFISYTVYQMKSLIFPKNKTVKNTNIINNIEPNEKRANNKATEKKEIEDYEVYAIISNCSNFASIIDSCRVIIRDTWCEGIEEDSIDEILLTSELIFLLSYLCVGYFIEKYKKACSNIVINQLRYYLVSQICDYVNVKLVTRIYAADVSISLDSRLKIYYSAHTNVNNGAIALYKMGLSENARVGNDEVTFTIINWVKYLYDADKKYFNKYKKVFDIDSNQYQNQSFPEPSPIEYGVLGQKLAPVAKKMIELAKVLTDEIQLVENNILSNTNVIAQDV